MPIPALILVVNLPHRVYYPLKYVQDSAEHVPLESTGPYRVQTFHPALTVKLESIRIRNRQRQRHHACLAHPIHTLRAAATRDGIVLATLGSSFQPQILVPSAKAENIPIVSVHRVGLARQVQAHLRVAQVSLIANVQQE